MEAAVGTPEPTQRLPREARGYFVVQGLGFAVPIAAAGIWGGGMLEAASDVPDGLGLALLVAALVAALAGAGPIPLLRYRVWRYEVRDYEIDLLRGALIVTRTLVPMTRVQHVDTRQTIPSQMFGLRSVVVHTAAGSHEIPALRPAEATAIRDRIALLAREPDEL